MEANLVDDSRDRRLFTFRAFGPCFGPFGRRAAGQAHSGAKLVSVFRLNRRTFPTASRTSSVIEAFNEVKVECRILKFLGSYHQEVCHLQCKRPLHKISDLLSFRPTRRRRRADLPRVLPVGAAHALLPGHLLLRATLDLETVRQWQNQGEVEFSNRKVLLKTCGVHFLYIDQLKNCPRFVLLSENEKEVLYAELFLP